MRTLAPNQTHTLAVDPRERFCPGGIQVEPGARYRFEATGKWRDAWITCGPNGWQGWVLNAGNRLPWHRFFLLCGAVGQDLSRAFPIGCERDWTAPPEAGAWTDRQLYFFANDWPGFYCNNHPLGPADGGPLTVVVRRLPNPGG